MSETLDNINKALLRLEEQAARYKNGFLVDGEDLRGFLRELKKIEETRLSWADEIYDILDSLEYTAPEKLDALIARAIDWRNRYRKHSWAHATKATS